MKRSVIVLIAGLIISSFLGGCTMSEQGTATGALLGGATGAIIGHQTGNRAEGALIGGAVGAIAGHGIGSANQKGAQQSAPQTIVKCPYCKSNIDVSGFPAGSEVRCPACNNVFTY
ncbi:MAG: glycine zipper 2TM domain-containing protein [Candidatus Aureabacteria bacterium]|nr:glycine zipper 2TM domain-containing protein [Candidatus Auribacterota bacterium]